MKKNIFLIFFSILVGIIFTFFILNKENIYAKEEYLVYLFQVGAYKSIDNAKEYAGTIPSSLILLDDNLYKVYGAIYKDTDLINKMVVYFENKDINIFLKTVDVDKEFYDTLDNYEKIIKNTKDEMVYDKVNQSILNAYYESKYEKID